MKPHAFGLALALLAAAAPPARAQPRIPLNRFEPAPLPSDAARTSSAEAFGHLRVAASVSLDYARRPLRYSLLRDDGSTTAIPLVASQTSGHLSLALGLADRVILLASLPLQLVAGSTTLPSGTYDADQGVEQGAIPLYRADAGARLGDLHFGLRVLLAEVGALSVAGSLAVTLPTARAADEEAHYVGAGGVAAHPEVLLTYHVGRARLLANVGVVLVPNVDDCMQGGAEGQCLSGAAWRDSVTYGVGAVVELHPQLNGVVDLNGVTAASHPRRVESPLEVTLGVKHHGTSGLTIGAFLAAGLVRGVGTPDYRLAASLGYATPAPPPAPVQPSTDVPDPAPADSDGDGLDDPNDACPDAAEDLDGFEDEDGCPDLDNDGDGVPDLEDECPMIPQGSRGEHGCPTLIDDRDEDGIPDNVDQCPDVAEDLDGFDDENGCPEPDNDGDGLPDGQDSCPDEPGPLGNRGCPWPDTDGDGIVDPLDSCVHEAGTADHHGCPTETTVIVTEDALQITDVVYFATNSDTIQARSFALLDQVATVLQEHPEIHRLRVEGHTDNRGRLAHNMDLSTRRAASVMRYLVGHGIHADRLESQGFGPTQPVVANARRTAEHAQNRRVAFVIVTSSAREP